MRPAIPSSTPSTARPTYAGSRPLRADAAHRYEQLLRYELAGLREVVAALENTVGGRELHECLAEAREEIQRLEIEVAWCAALASAMAADRGAAEAAEGEVVHLTWVRGGAAICGCYAAR